MGDELKWLLKEGGGHIFKSCDISLKNMPTSHAVSLALVINPRRTCTVRVTVLGLCICVSVTQHLTFDVFIHATNNTNLLGGG